MAARPLSMSDVRAVIDPDELKKGQAILDQRGLAHLARTDDKLYAEAQGSGSAPYRVSVAFGDRDQVKGRCSCRAAWSRPFCKHSAALLLAWSKTPEAFAATEVPREATADAKSSAAAPRRRTRAAKGDDAERPDAPRKLDNLELMRTGTERVSTLVRELAITGVGTITAERIAQLEELAASLRHLQLRRLSLRTLELAKHLQAGASLDAIRHA